MTQRKFIVSANISVDTCVRLDRVLQRLPLDTRLQALIELQDAIAEAETEIDPLGLTTKDYVTLGAQPPIPDNTSQRQILLDRLLNSRGAPLASQLQELQKNNRTLAREVRRRSNLRQHPVFNMSRLIDALLTLALNHVESEEGDQARSTTSDVRGSKAQRVGKVRRAVKAGAAA